MEEVRRQNALILELIRRTATSANVRKAVRDILNGEDVDLTKPGPQPTKAKCKQIADAKTYKKTHCGCSLYNACIKSFVHMPGGYASGESLYESMRQQRMGE